MCLAVCLSVCLSVRFVYYIQTSEDIIKLLSWPCSPILLVFLSIVPVPNSKETPSVGHQIQCGWENLKYSNEIAVYLGNGTR